ncbi:helix-turn-helix domain-containing protein [Streptomyces sp. NPDC051567]|uniref:helix-turn-helix domain-containing protein n=1 Tax=Streptomyces sp. NPDC051567 TaxID=3365660 RepID=UPI0037AC28C9
MSRRQKGRRHRTVNRTPRPVGPAAPRRVGPRTAPAPVGAAATGPVPVAGPVAVPVPAPSPEAVADADAEGIVFAAARHGGLGLPAARTWSELRAVGPGGASVADLSTAVGFTASTVARHLRGLASFGLAEQRGPHWHPAGMTGTAGTAG